MGDFPLLCREQAAGQALQQPKQELATGWDAVVLGSGLTLCAIMVAPVLFVLKGRRTEQSSATWFALRMASSTGTERADVIPCCPSTSVKELKRTGAARTQVSTPVQDASTPSRGVTHCTTLFVCPGSHGVEHSLHR